MLVGKNFQDFVEEILGELVVMSSIHFLVPNLNWNLAAVNLACFALLLKPLIKKIKNRVVDLSCHFVAALLVQNLASSLTATADSFGYHETVPEQFEIVIAAWIACEGGEVVLDAEASWAYVNL